MPSSQICFVCYCLTHKIALLFQCPTSKIVYSCPTHELAWYVIVFFQNWFVVHCPTHKCALSFHDSRTQLFCFCCLTHNYGLQFNAELTTSFCNLMPKPLHCAVAYRLNNHIALPGTSKLTKLLCLQMLK